MLFWDYVGCSPHSRHSAGQPRTLVFRQCKGSVSAAVQLLEQFTLYYSNLQAGNKIACSAGVLLYLKDGSLKSPLGPQNHPNYLRSVFPPRQPGQEPQTT